MEQSLLVRFSTLLSIALLAFTGCTPEPAAQHPNIVYILADDMGYGDVSALNSRAAWLTEHIDRIAEQGMVFTDAHSGSAVCTPTRYGVLTGRYSWRTRLKKGVLWSWDPPLIEPGETTVGSILQEKGYHTACIGKWHLGLGWQFHDSENDSVDFSKAITAGPHTQGFDYFFGITASLDIPPYVYIEDDKATMVPTRYTENDSEMGWWRKGLTADDFEHRQVLPLLTEKAVDYIDSRANSEEDEPFFLYFPLPAPHTPILPTDDFSGKSKTNPYGDFVLQVDHTVGQVLEALERNGISDETLVIFTSDNGCSPQANFGELARFGHNPSYHFRGTKADIFEGGHRVPFIVRWPGQVEAGAVNDQVVCLTDLLSTLASIVCYELPPSGGVDSYNMLPAMLGQTGDNIRDATVHHSINGSFAIRKGKWKLVLCPGSGGWSPPKPNSPELEGLPAYQLYNLEEDPGEQQNLYLTHPEAAKDLEALLSQYRESGRSTPTRPTE
jgi:arylsulfatase A